jgi:hypothetical protein
MDMQLRKERLEADLICRRIGTSRYSVVLDHESEQPLWTFWRSPGSGRWYGTNDMDDRVIDAPSLACAKMDLRLCCFPIMGRMDREHLLKTEVGA